MPPDGTARFAASHLGLCCLPMSHKKVAKLILVKFINVQPHQSVCTVRNIDYLLDSSSRSY